MWLCHILASKRFGDAAFALSMEMGTALSRGWRLHFPEDSKRFQQHALSVSLSVPLDFMKIPYGCSLDLQLVSQLIDGGLCIGSDEYMWDSLLMPYGFHRDFLCISFEFDEDLYEIFHSAP